MSQVDVVFTEGTHRVAAPSDTLARIAPSLTAMGITRAADITGLDRLGIPTWCAIRPAAVTLQVSNGKGVSHATAKVSALMEAIELWHAENPEGCLRASAAQLNREGILCVPPQALPDYRPGPHWSRRRIIHWVRGECLPDAAPVMLPACAGYVIEPAIVRFSTNGLASGNHPVEATLHALYEVIERDAVSRASRGGLSLPCGETRVVDLDTVADGPVAALRERVRASGADLVLIRVAGISPVSTFWAALVDPEAPFACSCVNMGHGSHLSPAVAAVRAITEAAQSRLTFIHGAREDLSPKSYEFSTAHERLRAFFQAQRGELDWRDIADHSSGDLARDLTAVLDGLEAAGHRRIYRVDLTKPSFGIPVVKVIVPGLVMGGFLDEDDEE